MNAAADRRLLFSLLGSIIALAWLALWVWERSPYGRYLNHGELGSLGDFGGAGEALFAAALYIAGWTLMTVAMMLPTTLPLVAIFRRLTMRRADRGQLLVLLIGGYLAIWMGFGIAAHLADWVLHEIVEGSPWFTSNSWVIGAGTLLVAGGFQFTPLKYRCLEKCRAPLSFVMEHWRGSSERWHAFRLGVNHGIFCVGCCWALMLLMFGVGIGNVGWMLGLGVVMAVEKNMPWGRRLSAPLGTVLLVWSAGIALNQLGVLNL